MRKVIQITNEPDFTPGVVTYVRALNITNGAYGTSPDLTYVKSLNDFSEEEINKGLDWIKKHHPKATVKLIEIE